MGALRLILALSVVLGHTGGLFGYVIIGGSTAVQCFYIVSGFVIAMILNEKYNVPAMNRAFYINRALRIYLLYYLFLALYFVTEVGAVAVFHKGVLATYAQSDLGLGSKVLLAALNLSIIGQDATLFLKADGNALAPTAAFYLHEPAVYRFMFILPAWSLSLELMFYVLAPLLARRRAVPIAAICAACLALRIAAYRHGLDGDPWSYRFFPFELGTFLVGVLGYKAYARFKDAAIAPALAKAGLALPVFILVGAPALHVAADDTFFAAGRIVTILAVAIAAPCLFALTRAWKYDRMVGELSFPLYLGHEWVVHLAMRSQWLAAHTNALSALVVVVGLVLAFVVMKLVDVPINRYRERLAQKARAQVDDRHAPQPPGVAQPT